MNGDEETKKKYAKIWTRWEMITSQLLLDKDTINKVIFISISRKSEDEAFAVTFASTESHYFVNGGFFKCKAMPFVDKY